MISQLEDEIYKPFHTDEMILMFQVLHLFMLMFQWLIHQMGRY
jgi:hypothetical protein